MPCHISSHWVLLVCWLKESRWENYDSLQSSLHRVGARANLTALHEDAAQAFPKGFTKWSVVDAVDVPKQENNWDCGIFVMKFMEAILSQTTISWKDHNKLHDDMPQVSRQTC
ncbi:hypothetical protein KSP40_PGU011478 [Platanthera guangdongensis]|uniref:Ubiquitin-like protease family profile domain-containing protein n=1 Tax=Platanthera guangdongensis TaxID=2320717 RepID=A0ABR2M6G1_9ASPA